MTDKENESQKAAGNSDPAKAKFETLKIYLKDASFEAPSTPGIFTQKNTPPKIEVEVLLDYSSIDDEQGLVDVVLNLTVTSKNDDGTLYLAEVHQAGVFQVLHPNPDARELVIEVTCPHILMPFAREEINSLITKGGFAAFLVSPVNFDVVYRDKSQKQEEQAKAASNPKSLN
jgi:preprotein translocase subunit SecB